MSAARPLHAALDKLARHEPLTESEAELIRLRLPAPGAGAGAPVTLQAFLGSLTAEERARGQAFLDGITAEERASLDRMDALGLAYEDQIERRLADWEAGRHPLQARG